MPLNRAHPAMPWATESDQEAGFVVAKEKAQNLLVLSPTLTIAQAAARLGANPMDLWGLIHRGECPGLRRFGRYVIEESALNEVLEVLTRP
ncbi:MAG: helix-turn-helix domain-containing protein [Phycisphaerales bacterium JB058]